MLGEKIGQEKGRVTSRRVLTGGPSQAVVETSFEATGELLGVKIQSLGTYNSHLRPDGTMFGEGQGVVMGRGGESARWKGQGIGTSDGKGGFSFRGAIYYETQSSPWERLNRCAAVFEHQVDAEGNTTSQLFEWR
ncbi:MAG: hypothetical protein HY825_20495 [Acidobacteria bacterium]|nr:hypothetical protein [Acidobacteriota bacterium]